MTCTAVPPPAEVCEQFDCFGGTCTVIVMGAGPAGPARSAAAAVRRRMLDWHRQFSRFDPSSELSALNDDRREHVPVSAMMVRFVAAALDAAELTGGLVDPTLIGELEEAGYAAGLGSLGTVDDELSGLRPAPRAAGPDPRARWRDVAADPRARIVARPVGLRLDSGGIAKGMFGDVLAQVLSRHDSFVVAAAGDIRFGGAAGIARPLQVASPFTGGGLLHTFHVTEGAVATSGTTKRRWRTADGGVAHHLIDPATGAPAFTGVVQATALAPTGAEAEARAKAAVLAGPDHAIRWLPYGGVIAYDDGTHTVIEADGGLRP